MDDRKPVKVINIYSCNDCPFNGGCQAWKKLSRKQRVTLALGMGVQREFILRDCHLDDAK